jgi:PAS domain S-box-containing protein
MKWSLERKTSAGFGLALAMAAVLGVISYLDTRHLIESTRGIAHTQEVLKEIQGVVAGYRDAEAQARGYVLTGNEISLVRYGDASALIRAHAQRLSALAAEDPREQALLQQLDRSVDLRLATLAELIHARKDKGLEAAREIESSPVAQKARQKEVDEFRGIIGALEDQENLELSQRTVEAQMRDRRTIVALALLILVAVPYLFVTYLYILRELLRRKRTEADLAEKSAYLNALIENSPLGIVVLDSERRIRLCNPAFLSLFQFQPTDVGGAPIEVLIGTTGSSDEATELVRRISSGEILEVTRRLRRKDGTEIDVEIHAVSLRVEGKTVGTLGLCRDITERRKASAALEEANERLALLLQETEQRAHESSQLSQLGELLLSCQTAEEAYDIVAKVMLKLFPVQSGALCVINSSRNLVEVVAVWGSALTTERAFTPDDCWALRRGRVHVMGDGSSAPRCAHMQAPVSSYTVCIPMVAQGETVGVLHLEDATQLPGEEAAPGEPLVGRVRLAATIAEQVSLSLANLRLREALRNQSIRDPLTGLFNRRYLDDSLQREVRRATCCCAISGAFCNPISARTIWRFATGARSLSSFCRKQTLIPRASEPRNSCKTSSASTCSTAA